MSSLITSVRASLGTLLLLLVPVAHAKHVTTLRELPQELSAQILQEGRFLPFHQLADGPRAPIGTNISINGKKVPNSDFETINRFFLETHLASVPPQTRIEQNRDAQGRDVWEYPVGTRLIHLIQINSKVPSVFELRMSEKLGPRQWGFGSYVPSSDGKRLFLRQTEALVQESGTATLANGQPLEYSIKRIHILSCQNCHFAMSPSNYQYATREETGPCGFVPANAAGVRSWASEYAKTHGQEPLGF